MSNFQQRQAYFVLVSPAYGGAEKRFFDIFRAMRQRGLNIELIAPSLLIERLRTDHGAGIEADGVHAVPMQSWSPKQFIVGLRALLATLPRGSRFHYPMNCLWPLHIGRGDKVSMSVTNCINLPRAQAATRNANWTWLSFFFVKRVDVLSPRVFNAMRSYRMAPKMSLTPGGTFIEISELPTVPRRPVVALLTRLIPQKGIDDWLDVVPEIWDRMRAAAPADFAFEIAGYGPLQEHLVGRVDALFTRRIPIRFVGYADAAHYLPGVSAVVSMQEVTNYPSRVVAEGLVSGCAVIVRDTGDSAEFGKLRGLHFCRPELDPAQLAEFIAQHFHSLSEDKHYPQSIRTEAIERFSAGSTVSYFADLLDMSHPYTQSST
jgi:glycosyltransferase involved in cell wall biosynthesis